MLARITVGNGCYNWMNALHGQRLRSRWRKDLGKSRFRPRDYAGLPAPRRGIRGGLDAGIGEYMPDLNRLRSLPAFSS